MSPVTQATCRYCEYPTDAKTEQLLRLQVQTIERQFSNSNILAASSNEFLSDCKANYIQAAFSIKNEYGIEMDCMSRSWSIFNNNVVYTLGMSGAYGKEDDYQSDHEFILNSVLIGKGA